MLRFFLTFILFTAACILAPVSRASEVTVSWDDNSTAETGFVIEQKIGSGNFAEVGRVAADVISYRAVSLAEATRYTWRVRAIKVATGEDDIFSDYSNEATYKTKLNAPSNTKTSEIVIVKLGRGQRAEIYASK